MSVSELAERLAKMAQSGAHLDWQKIREEIINEHQNATTADERLLWLSLHKTVMDLVERHTPLEQIEAFQTTRRQDYCTLLISEAIVGRTDGTVPPDKLAEITRREVREGRLSADDNLHILAVNAAKGIFPQSNQQQSGGFFARVRSWLGR
jgi:hypothetical protein